MRILVLSLVVFAISSCAIFSGKKESKTEPTENKVSTEKMINKVSQFISPNGDGKNDCWQIPELEKYPKNVLKLFNRWGKMVYEKEAYMGQFCGVPNPEIKDVKVEKDGVLPNGTYFYIIDLGSDSKDDDYTGYMQIQR